MPIVTRKPTPPTALQTFRSITEGYLLQVAQRAMLRRYPGAGTRPAPKQGWIYWLLPWLFLPGYRLTPWPIRQRLLTLFFVRPVQRWPERPWEQGETGE